MCAYFIYKIKSYTYIQLCVWVYVTYVHIIVCVGMCACVHIDIYIGILYLYAITYCICRHIIFDFKYKKQWNDIQTHTKLSIIITPNGVSKASLYGEYIVARLIHVHPFIHLLLNFET